MRTSIPFCLSILLASSALILTACSGAPAPIIEQASAKAAARPTPAQPEAAEATPPRSVFTVDKNSRDPFFPKARFDEEEKSPTDVAFDVPAILQQNFHGVISSAGKSIAYVNNIMLEEGRHAMIPIRASGQEKQVKVHCIEVTKDSVVLQVQGYPEPVRLKRSGR
jgi:hypothetical protein